MTGVFFRSVGFVGEVGITFVGFFVEVAVFLIVYVWNSGTGV